MIEEATGRKAFVTGKPSPVMMRSARKYFGLETGEQLLGDSIETDIQGGVQMGYKTILVSLWHGQKVKSQPFCLQTRFNEQFNR